MVRGPPVFSGDSGSTVVGIGILTGNPRKARYCQTASVPDSELVHIHVSHVSEILELVVVPHGKGNRTDKE